MNYQGQPCKNCGGIITVYSLSGLCRKCWHHKRGTTEPVAKIPPLSKPKETEEQRIRRIIEFHRSDLTHYHTLSIDCVPTPEHRYIWEQINGKILKGWIIHHLNGLKGDNRIENLVAMPRSDHDSKSLVNALKARIRQLELKGE